MGWERELKRARKLHRPSLRDWSADGLKDVFPQYLHTLDGESLQYQCFKPCEEVTPAHIPACLDARDVTAERFFDEFEINEIPCVIRGIPEGHDSGRATKPWPACKNWAIENLKEDDELLDRMYKCGEDDEGYKVKVKLRHFLKYVDHNYDDSPLYVFDSNFDEDKYAKRILKDYAVPSYFADDLFRFVSESRRPPYRWWLVGPKRSGTTVHIDPLDTSAWNTLVHGKKRWVLFPPHVPKSIVKGKGLIRSDEDDEAVHYFMYILPRIKRKAASLQNSPSYHNFACYEFTQNPGQTVFIPSGWWHAVLNLTDTVGVTQNFCSPRNFDKVWIKTRSGRKRMAWKLLCQLDKHYPELANRARAMNERDSFRMKYDPEEIARRKSTS